MKKWTMTTILLTMATVVGPELTAAPSHSGDELTRSHPAKSYLAQANDDDFYDDEDEGDLSRSRRAERKRRRERLLDRYDTDRPGFWVHKTRKNIVGASIFGGFTVASLILSGSEYRRASYYTEEARKLETAALFLGIISNSSFNSNSYLLFMVEMNAADEKRMQAEYSRVAGQMYLGLGAILAIPTTILTVRAIRFSKRAEEMKNEADEPMSGARSGDVYLGFQPRLRERGGDVRLTFLF